MSDSDDELRARIAQAAYFKAQSAGFPAGRELDFWLAAEREFAQPMDVIDVPESLAEG